MLWRHGDVLITSVSALPEGAQPRSGATLAYGEVTGHSHRFAEPSRVALWTSGLDLFVQVIDEQATLIHEEHKPIVLTRGTYRVWKQREYTPTAIRTVVD